MSNLRLPITNHDQTILRPIVFTIVNDLKRYLGIEYITKIPINYIGDDGTISEFGTSVNDTQREGLFSESDAKITLAVTEEEFENSKYLYTDYSPEFPPIYRDDDIGVTIIPYYSSAELKIEITYSAQSKAEAKQWQNRMKTKIKNMSEMYSHNLSYNYIIDKNIMYILTESYKLVKNRNKKVEPMSDYLRNRFVNRFGTISDTAGKNIEFAINETQTRIRGFFDFGEAMDQGSKVDGPNAWTVTVEYLIRYMRPTSLLINYPLVIYNQVVPDTLIFVDKDGNVKNRDIYTEYPRSNRYYTLSAYNLSHFDPTDRPSLDQDSQFRGVIIPRWNEFTVEDRFSIIGTKRFFDQLILFNEDDFDILSKLKKDRDIEPIFPIYNLDKITQFSIDEDILNFIKSEGKWLFITGESLFQLGLYRNNRLLIRDIISMDEDYNILLNRPIDIKGIYNIRCAIYYNWSYLSSDAIRRIRDSGIFDKIEYFLTKGRPDESNNYKYELDNLGNTPFYPKRNVERKNAPYYTVQTFNTINYSNLNSFKKETLNADYYRQ